MLLSVAAVVGAAVVVGAVGFYSAWSVVMCHHGLLVQLLNVHFIGFLCLKIERTFIYSAAQIFNCRCRLLSAVAHRY